MTRDKGGRFAGSGCGAARRQHHSHADQQPCTPQRPRTETRSDGGHRRKTREHQTSDSFKLINLWRPRCADALGRPQPTAVAERTLGQQIRTGVHAARIRRSSAGGYVLPHRRRVRRVCHTMPIPSIARAETASAASVVFRILCSFRNSELLNGRQPAPRYRPEAVPPLNTTAAGAISWSGRRRPRSTRARSSRRLPRAGPAVRLWCRG